MQKFYVFFTTALLTLAAHVLSAQAALDFENFSVGTNHYIDTGDPFTAHSLVNNSLPQTQPIIEPQAGQLGIEIEFTPTRTGTSGAAGLSDGDLFGPIDINIPATAQNGMGSVTIDYDANPPSSGDQVYTMEDPDGLVTLHFTEVDLTGTTSPSFSMEYIFSDVSYEASAGSTDRVRIYLKIDGTTEIDLLNVEADAVPNDEMWRTLSQDLTAYIGSTVQLIIEMDTDAGTEEMAIDNISFTEGTVVLPCEAPVINGVTIVSCDPNSSTDVTLEVDGQLNDATTWEWTQVGAACEGTFAFASGPQVTGNYFAAPDGIFHVRAVGGCVETPVCFEFVPSQLLGQLSAISLSTTAYCEDAGVQSGLSGGSPTGGVYSGPGVTDDGNGMTFSFDPAMAGVGSHEIVYTRNTGTACGESSAQTSVQVFALPTVTFTPPGPFTTTDGVQALSGGMPAGGTYSGTGVMDNSFDPAATGAGTFTITYTYTDANGCTASAMGDITVEADCVAPVINGITVIDCPPDPSGTFTIGVDGELNGAAQWIIEGLTFTGSFQLTFLFPDELYMVCSSGGCVEEQVCFSFIPNDFFGISTLSLTTTTYCQDAAVQTGLSGGSPTGGVYSGPGVTDDGNGTTYTFDPAAAGVGSHTISYSVNGQCDFSPSTTTVEIFALPTVAFTPPGPFTTTDGVQALTGGMPVGGTYSGTGVTDNSFDPAAVGAGTFTITYTYTDANGCTATATGDITVEMVVLPGDACADANDISSLFGQAFDVPQTSGIFDNTGYTAVDDPTTGYECFDDGTLERTTWYSFTGDGNNYRIKTVQCNATNYLTNGDTQIAIYSGDCMNPVAVACNEDEDFGNDIYNANVEFLTEPGVTYLMMIDGWNGANYSAEGEFCIEVTNLTPSGVISIDQTEIKVFPNPTNGILHFDNVDPEQVEVFDSAGQRVLSKVRPGYSLDMQQLPAGLYFLKIFTGEEVVSVRVVKE